MRCTLCFHNCELKEGQVGFCLGRINKDGHIIARNYGQLTSLALDPIEKKPLSHFHPGSMILSAGSYGCNLKCPFCQNYMISYDDGKEVEAYVSPYELVAIAQQYVPQGNIGIAFTYNEPLISYEYVMDTFKLAKEQGLKTVLVTNGTINQAPFKALLPYVDAMNIDLKGFTPEVYQQLGGSLAQVKETIVAALPACHVEITTLIVPGLNDDAAMIKEEAQWLSTLDEEIVLHISRFFPRYHLRDRYPTSLMTIERCVKEAKTYLRHVYKGNC